PAACEGIGASARRVMRVSELPKTNQRYVFMFASFFGRFRRDRGRLCPRDARLIRTRSRGRPGNRLAARGWASAQDSWTTRQISGSLLATIYEPLLPLSVQAKDAARIARPDQILLAFADRERVDPGGGALHVADVVWVVGAVEHMLSAGKLAR